MPRISQSQSSAGHLGKSVLAGFFGAMAPNVLQGTAQAATSSGGVLLVAEVTFWLGAVVAASLGALLVFFYDERSPKRAITLGAAAPALLLGLATGLPTQGGAGRVANDNHPIAQVGHVRSQVASVQGGEGSRIFATSAVITLAHSTVVVVRGTGMSHASHLTLVAVNSRHSTVGRYAFRESGDRIHVPEGTIGLFVIADGAKSNSISIEGVEADSVTLKVTVTVPAVRGFARAFGVHNAGSIRVRLELAGKSKVTRPTGTPGASQSRGGGARKA